MLKYAIVDAENWEQLKTFKQFCATWERTEVEDGGVEVIVQITQDRLEEAHHHPALSFQYDNEDRLTVVRKGIVLVPVEE